MVIPDGDSSILCLGVFQVAFQLPHQFHPNRPYGKKTQGFTCKTMCPTQKLRVPGLRFNKMPQTPHIVAVGIQRLRGQSVAGKTEGRGFAKPTSFR